MQEGQTPDGIGPLLRVRLPLTSQRPTLRYVRHWRIDDSGLTAHLRRLARGVSEYDIIVSASMNSAEARAKHQATDDPALPPLEYLRGSTTPTLPTHDDAVL